MRRHFDYGGSYECNEDGRPARLDWGWMLFWFFVGCCIAHGLITVWDLNDCGCG